VKLKRPLYEFYMRATQFKQNRIENREKIFLTYF